MGGVIDHTRTSTTPEGQPMFEAHTQRLLAMLYKVVMLSIKLQPLCQRQGSLALSDKEISSVLVLHLCDRQKATCFGTRA